MRKRFQKGSVRKFHGSWIGRYRKDGKQVSIKLGRVSELKTKSAAEEKLAEILRPINARTQSVTRHRLVKDFVEQVYFPVRRETWKRSTAMTTEDRIRFHLIGEFGQRPLAELSRAELQTFLKDRARTLSASTVKHLRWDLSAIFKLAMAEGCIQLNPTIALATPRACQTTPVRTMNKEEVIKLLTPLDLRERLIVTLALFAGMRPGEIFALRRGAVTAASADISERVYRGDLDTPKTVKSFRLAGLSRGLGRDLAEWLAISPDTGPTGWLFPSEKLNTPLWPNNFWRRHIRPKLQKIGLAWVNFLVLRHTYSTIARSQKQDPKVVADQLGHTVDVNLNVYTESMLERKIESVEAVECVLIN